MTIQTIQTGAIPLPRVADLEVMGASHKRLHRLFGFGELKCSYCRRDIVCEREGLRGFIDNAIVATLDHAVPTSRGGSNRDDNLTMACMACNSSKNNRIWPDEWILDQDNRTYIQPCSITSYRGDSLATIGTIWLMSIMDGEFHLVDFANLVKETPIQVRRILSLLVKEGRLSRTAELAKDSGYIHVYRGVAA